MNESDIVVCYRIEFEFESLMSHSKRVGFFITTLGKFHEINMACSGV